VQALDRLCQPQPWQFPHFPQFPLADWLLLAGPSGNSFPPPQGPADCRLGVSEVSEVSEDSGFGGFGGFRGFRGFRGPTRNSGGTRRGGFRNFRKRYANRQQLVAAARSRRLRILSYR